MTASLLPSPPLSGSVPMEGGPFIPAPAKAGKRLWTPEEDDVLRYCYDRFPRGKAGREAVRRTHRSLRAVHQRLRAINLKICVNRLPGPNRPWTAAEKDLLRRRYGPDTPDQLAAQLNRSPGAVRNMLRELGMAMYTPKHVIITPEMDAIITQEWTMGRKGRTKRLAEQFNTSTGWIKYRARQLGLTRSTGSSARWTPEDTAILEQYHDTHGARGLSTKLRKAGFVRSPEAVQAHLFELGFSWRYRDGYNQSEFARLMGVNFRQVAYWQKRGWLKAKRENRSEIRQDDEAHCWWIEPRDARAFLLAYPTQYSLGKVDKFWFINTLCPRNGIARIADTDGCPEGGLPEHTLALAA